MLQLNSEQQRWLGQLYLRKYDTLFAFALRQLSSHTLAEEAVQDTYLIACSKISDLMGSPNPDGWLMETLKYVLLKRKTKRMQENTLFAAALELDESLVSARKDGIAELDLAGEQILGKQSYYILKCVLLKELSIEAAARIMGVSADACRKRIERNKKRLRKIF